MKRTVILGWILVTLGCGEKDQSATDDTDEGGACGSVSTHVLSVAGVVQFMDGTAASGVNVRLDDRGWNPGSVLAEGVSLEGEFNLDSAEITSVEECWGTLLDYVLVASLEGYQGEKEINTQLFNAIRDGESTADVSAIPIVLEPVD